MGLWIKIGIREESSWSWAIDLHFLPSRRRAEQQTKRVGGKFLEGFFAKYWRSLRQVTEED